MASSVVPDRAEAPDSAVTSNVWISFPETRSVTVTCTEILACPAKPPNQVRAPGETG